MLRKKFQMHGSRSDTYTFCNYIKVWYRGSSISTISISTILDSTWFRIMLNSTNSSINTIYKIFSRKFKVLALTLFLHYRSLVKLSCEIFNKSGQKFEIMNLYDAFKSSCDQLGVKCRPWKLLCTQNCNKNWCWLCKKLTIVKKGGLWNSEWRFSWS